LSGIAEFGLGLRVVRQLQMMPRKLNPEIRMPTDGDNVRMWHLSEVPPCLFAGLLAAGKQKWADVHPTAEFDPHPDIGGAARKYA
jgi:hypothetical protein